MSLVLILRLAVVKALDCDDKGCKGCVEKGCVEKDCVEKDLVKDVRD